MALLTFPPNPNNGDKYPLNPLPGQNQYEWSAADNTWRLLGAATGVIPGCYGDGLTIPAFCVNSQGQLESVTPTAIPDATTISKGVVQIGSNIQVAGGIISVDIATTANLGVVQVGSNIQVAAGVISVLTASTTDIGVVRLATSAETTTGTDATTAVTPFGLQSKVSDSISLNSSTNIASSFAVKTAYDLANAAVPDSTYTAKGDIVVGTGASTYSALGVGANGQVLTADSASPEGVSWQTPLVYRYVQFDDISTQFDDVADTFNLTVGTVATSPVPPTNIMVFLGGVVQIPGDAYTITGSQITFDDPPPAGSSFYATTVST